MLLISNVLQYIFEFKSKKDENSKQNTQKSHLKWSYCCDWSLISHEIYPGLLIKCLLAKKRKEKKMMSLIRSYFPMVKFGFKIQFYLLTYSPDYVALQ